MSQSNQNGIVLAICAGAWVARRTQKYLPCEQWDDGANSVIEEFFRLEIPEESLMFRTNGDRAKPLFFPAFHHI